MRLYDLSETHEGLQENIEKEDKNSNRFMSISDEENQQVNKGKIHKNIASKGQESVYKFGDVSREKENSDVFTLNADDSSNSAEDNLAQDDLAAYEQIIEDSDVEIIEKPPMSKKDLIRIRKEQEISDEKPVCIICYGEPTNAVVTECGHVYCCECLHEYRNKNFTTCAVCRKHYNDKNNHLVIMKSVLVPKL